MKKYTSKKQNDSINENDADGIVKAYEAEAYLLNWLGKRKDILGENRKQRATLTNGGIGDFFKSKKTLEEDTFNQQMNNLRTTKYYDIGTDKGERDYLKSDLGNLISEKYSRDFKKPISVKDALSYESYLSKGAFSPFTNSILINDGYKDKDNTILHEKTHSLRAIPQYDKINKIIIPGNSEKKLKVPYDSYLDNSGEIYSRLMEFRKSNNLNPLKTYKKLDIQKLKQSGKDFDILNRYTDEQVEQLLNNVASSKKNNKTIA